MFSGEPGIFYIKIFLCLGKGEQNDLFQGNKGVNISFRGPNYHNHLHIPNECKSLLYAEFIVFILQLSWTSYFHLSNCTNMQKCRHSVKHHAYELYQ